MNQAVSRVCPRPVPNSPRPTRSTPQQILSALLRRPPQHPALYHPAEEHSIQHSLDLSFHQDITVSQLDRQIIDNLSRRNSQRLQWFEPLQLLAPSS